MHDIAVIELLRYRVIGLKGLTISIMVASLLLFSRNGSCDILRLKEVPEGKKGNEVEILEEREDSFIVKIPKDEIEVIKKKRPSEIKLWKEKKILWEDQGDYITIFLPKERVVTPEKDEEYKEGTYFGKAKTETLSELLSSTGAEPTYRAGDFLAHGKGRVIGRVLNRGKPVSGCKVKLVYVKQQVDIFSKLFGAKEETSSQEQGEFVFETETNEKGLFEFTGVPMGDYDIYWLPPAADAWIRKLTEKPEVTVRPGQTFEYKEMDIAKLR